LFYDFLFSQCHPLSMPEHRVCLIMSMPELGFVECIQSLIAWTIGIRTPQSVALDSHSEGFPITLARS
jgi:hypothetical protein